MQIVHADRISLDFQTLILDSCFLSFQVQVLLIPLARLTISNVFHTANLSSKIPTMGRQH